MKKKLLMAAVGAALVAGPMVAAHAAGATLYGHLHMSMDRIDNGNGEEGFMSSNSSRFGIKGDEDLGGGLKAIYQMETGGFSADEGTGGLGGTLRNTFMGFSSGWGTVKFGRHDTPYKDLSRKIDNFNEQMGDARNVLGDASGTISDFDNRASNMIRYDSPTIAGGLQLSALYARNTALSAGGTDTTVTATSPFVPATAAAVTKSVSATWTAGPMWLALGWMENGTNNPTTPGLTDRESGMRFAGSYTMNDLTFSAIYEQIEDYGGISGLDWNNWGLGAAFKMGNNKLKAQWYNSDDCELNTPPGACDKTGFNMLSLGVDHTFSKTAMVYFNYAKMSNDDNAGHTTISSNAGHGETVPAGAGPSPAFAAKDVDGYSVGAIIKF